MKRTLFVLLVWASAGAGTVMGSVLGSRGGQRWLFAGAIIGGALAIILATRFAARLGLIARRRLRASTIGGLVGFAVALPLAVTNLHTPVVPVLSTSLIALGALLGDFHFDGRENFRLQTEVIMRTHSQVAIAGFVLILPALVLVSSGLLGLDPPAALVHPVLVMGGLLLAFALNAWSVSRVTVGQDGVDLVGTISIRMVGGRMNLLALGVTGLLAITLGAYLFMENFRPR